LEQSVFTLLTPLQRGVAALVDSVSGAWYGYLDLRGVRDENRKLAERLAALETEVMQLRHRSTEAERLFTLLELRRALPLQSIVAPVVARDGMPWFRSVTLAKGKEEGVRLNAPVICPSGVVGRVVSLGPHAAKVQLLLDRDSGVGVLVERSRVAGIVAGQVGRADSGSHDLAMRYVPALADVAQGDRVVTSGFDRIFPKGLLVGRVRSVGPASGLFREVVVDPSARFDRLEEVLVLEPPQEDLSLTEAVR
jgi:rod shape-determining protein MreC